MGLFNGKTAEPVNPPHGEKGHFRKITITLPPGAYEKLIHESARRKIAGEPNHLLSALLREAVDHYMPLLEDTAEEQGLHTDEKDRGNYPTVQARRG